MTFAGFKALVEWQVMLLGVAVLVYWTFYHSLDPQTTSTYAGATFDTQNAAMHGFLDHWRANFGSWFHTGTDWRNQIYDGLTTPK